MSIKVEHDVAGQRFVAVVEGAQSVADYRLANGVMQMTHTVVPPHLEGRGIAAKLVEAAFAHATANKLRIDPQCSYVRSYMQRHPETASLHV